MLSTTVRRASHIEVYPPLEGLYLVILSNLYDSGSLVIPSISNKRPEANETGERIKRRSLVARGVPHRNGVV